MIQRISLLVLLMVSLALLPACASENNNNEPVIEPTVQIEGETGPASEETVEAEHEAFEAEAEADLAGLRAQLEDLREQAGQASGEVQAELNQRIEELEPQAEVAEQKLRDLREAGAEGWEQIEPEVKSALQTLEDGLIEASAFIIAAGQAAAEEIEQTLEQDQPEVEEDAQDLDQ